MSTHPHFSGTGEALPPRAPSGAIAPILQMRDISKGFGPVRVLDRISLDCHAGEVHALCGENGAGKSTLIKVLGGVYQPDGGDIVIQGRGVRFAHPVEARQAGISIIHQELSLLPHRTVAQNIFLGREQSRSGFIDRAGMVAEARRILDRLASNISPEAMAGRLSIAEQQMVEIAKALAVEARILVLDEPTAPLDASESARLFGVIAELRRSGVAIIYISHRMKEVFDLADRITVLKDGQRTASVLADAVSPDEVIRLMVGRPLEEFFPPHGSNKAGQDVLRIVGASNARLSNIDLTLRAGEIVGVAGLEGSGKGELAKAIFGAEPFLAGTMSACGHEGLPMSPREGARRSIAYLSDDRKSEGLGLRQSLLDNAALALRCGAAMLGAPWASGRSRSGIEALFRRVEMRTASFEQPVDRLSGGNQQKVVIARWLATSARLWVVVEPTRGIDVGAKATIYRLLRDFAESGGAVLMVSSDLAEIIGLSDRILVMAGATLVGDLPAGSTEEEILARAMTHGRAAHSVLH